MGLIQGIKCDKCLIGNFSKHSAEAAAGLQVFIGEHCICVSRTVVSCEGWCYEAHSMDARASMLAFDIVF